ncbi:MAG: helix-turn-helix domain-containing protein [Streptococcaceae bacterium]|jgi:cytoskeletal protein RodZ|nr:helix-turn-helix domain-containing protein [Streptococcaceae bacterium]
MKLNQMTVGERLRAARNERHLTYQEVQQISKVQQKYLEAIEADMFQLLPSEFYAKAFIRQFAQAVGEDGERLVDLYLGKPYEEEIDEDTAYLKQFIEDERYDDDEEIFQPVAASRVTHNDKGFKKNIPMFILGFVALLIIGAVIFVTVHYNNQNSPIADGGGNITLERETTTTTTTQPAQETTTTTTSQPKPEPEFTLSETGREPTQLTLQNGVVNGTQINFKAENMKFPIDLNVTLGARITGRIQVWGANNQEQLLPRTVIRQSGITALQEEQFATQTGESKYFEFILEGYQNSAPWTYQFLTKENLTFTINGKEVTLGDDIPGFIKIRVEFTSAPTNNN